MTDFSTELLPEEEQTEPAAARGETFGTPENQAEGHERKDERAILASVGNESLSQHLPPKSKPEKRPATSAAKRKSVANTSLPPAMNEPDQNPAREAEQGLQPNPTPLKGSNIPETASEQQDRLHHLSQVLLMLLNEPENAGIEALFQVFQNAPVEEQSRAALAISNLVLRVSADRRPRVRKVLTSAIKACKSCLMAQILLNRLGAWVSNPKAPKAAPGSDP